VKNGEHLRMTAELVWLSHGRINDADERSSKPCQSEALHLVSAPFGTPFLGRPKDAVVAQLVRAPVCGTGGRWFEPTQLYQQIQRLTSNAKIFRIRLAEAIAEVK
jgi:hypothetical protein